MLGRVDAVASYIPPSMRVPVDVVQLHILRFTLSTISSYSDHYLQCHFDFNKHDGVVVTGKHKSGVKAESLMKITLKITVGNWI